MKNIYLNIIKKADKTGVVNLKQRKEIWKDFDVVTSDGVTARMKRFRLAFECIRKVASGIREDTPLSAVRKDLEYLIGILDEAGNRQGYQETMEKLCSYCREEVEETDDFVVGYFQQAIEHMIQILEEDEPLLTPEYELAVKDEKLEIEETDTSYCAAIVWKYLDEGASESKRKRLEREFWLWYVQTAASIQGVQIDYVPDKADENEEGNGDNQAAVINSLDEFVKAISYEFKYESGERDDKLITLNVLSLNEDDTCPFCGQNGSYYGLWRGLTKLGQIKGWKVQLKVKENYYHCTNPSCKEGYVPQKKVGYKEKMANFKYLIGNAENKKRLCEMFEKM